MCRVIFRSCYSLMPAANPSTTFVSSWRVFSSASTTCSGAFNEKEKCRRDSQAKRFSQTDREVYDSVGAIRHCVPFVRNPTSDQHWRRSRFFYGKIQKSMSERLVQSVWGSLSRVWNSVHLSKFGDRITSRRSANRWPTCSPDMSCLDCSFSLKALEYVEEVERKTLQELKKVVEGFAAGMSE